MSKKIGLEDKRTTTSLPLLEKDDDEEPLVKFRISPLVAPYAPEDKLVQEPGETLMDNTDQLAYGAPRFKKEEKTVTVLSADNDVVKWYKQRFLGTRCSCLDDKEDKSSVTNLIKKAYCPKCYHTGIEGAYDYYRHVRLLNIYIEWGGIEPPMPSGRLDTSLDFDYHVTPGDFFELGKIVADIGFNVDAAVNERHDNEGKPCLWRVLDVTVARDGETGFALGWAVSCQNIEPYEPIYGWFEQNIGAENG